MKPPGEMTLVELLEQGADRYEYAAGLPSRELETPVLYRKWAAELRSRAARLREALIATEQGTRDFPGSGMVSRFDALRAINAPSSTPIADDPDPKP